MKLKKFTFPFDQKEMGNTNYKETPIANARYSASYLILSYLIINIPEDSNYGYQRKIIQQYYHGCISSPYFEVLDKSSQLHSNEWYTIGTFINYEG